MIGWKLLLVSYFQCHTLRSLTAQHVHQCAQVVSIGRSADSRAKKIHTWSWKYKMSYSKSIFEIHTVVSHLLEVNYLSTERELYSCSKYLFTSSPNFQNLHSCYLRSLDIQIQNQSTTMSQLVRNLNEQCLWEKYVGNNGICRKLLWILFQLNRIHILIRLYCLCCTSQIITEYQWFSNLIFSCLFDSLIFTTRWRFYCPRELSSFGMDNA